jgi:hypothetical protein
MKRDLKTVEEASKAISSGKPLLLAGDEAVLRKLPRGNWVGGTIPYFMSEDGGVHSTDRVHVTELPEFAGKTQIKLYDPASLPSVAREAPEYGISFIIVPASSPVHLTFAENAPGYDEIFMRPLVGWIAGVSLDQIGKVTPKVFSGATGEVNDNAAAVMHVELPKTKAARIKIINVFEQGDGDAIYFDQTGFSAKEALINGKRVSFSTYLADKKADTRLPLVADYYGAMINTSFQSVDAAAGVVNFYAPVFKGLRYKIARPISNYSEAFAKAAVSPKQEPAFCCNCILNYVYGELEGKKTGAFRGPITFGEIAYQLLNQTLVYLEFGDL